MSHHFDTPTAKEDPRINICDFYLFRGRPEAVKKHIQRSAGRLLC
jgi:hypothetical protein